MTDLDSLPPAAASSESNNPELSNLIKRTTILMSQKDWQTAIVYCQKALDSNPENPELYLMLCMINRQISDEDELQHAACNLTVDQNFQTAIRLSSMERTQQLLDIQAKCRFNFVNFLLRQCMGKYQIPGDESNLVCCPVPLREEQQFQSALTFATPEHRDSLAQLQDRQVDYYLEACKKRHPGTKLEFFPESLKKEPNFQMAIRCADPMRRAQLLQLQEQQPHNLLKKCMEQRGISDLRGLKSAKAESLENDVYFKLAMECATPEFRQELKNIQSQQNLNIFLAHPIIAALIVLGIIAFTLVIIIPNLIKFLR